jgi:hypothetical protein
MDLGLVFTTRLTFVWAWVFLFAALLFGDASFGAALFVGL